METQTERDKAIEIYSKDLETAKSINDKPGMIKNYHLLGLSCDIQGNSGRAMTMYNEALKIAQEINANEAMMMSYVYLQDSYMMQGNLDKAFEMYQKSTTFDNRGMGLGYISYGNFYKTRGNLRKAIELYSQALQIYEMNEKYLMPSAYLDLGEAYKMLGEFDNAIETYLKILHFDCSLLPFFKDTLADAYIKLGLVYAEKHNESESRNYYQKSVALLKLILKDNPNNFKFWKKLGDALILTEELYDAIQAYQKVLELGFDKKYARDEVAAACASLGHIYHQQGNITEARNYWQKSFDLYSFMSNPEAEKIHALLNNLNYQPY